MHAKDALRDDLATAHSHELETRDDQLARMQKEHGEERIRVLERHLADKEGKIAELAAALAESGEGGGDLSLSASESVGEVGHLSVTLRRLSLPSVPELNGEKLDDEDAFLQMDQEAPETCRDLCEKSCCS